MKPLVLACLLLAALPALPAAPAVAAGAWSTVMRWDDPVPDVPDRSWYTLGTPVIDDTGAVWFVGYWGGSNAAGALFTVAGGVPDMFLGHHTTFADLDGFFFGRVTQLAVARGGLAEGLAVGSPNETMAFSLTDTFVLHDDGAPAPAGDGTLGARTGELARNRQGQVVWSVRLDDTPGGTEDDRAILLHDPRDGHRRVVTEGDPWPTGTDVFAGSCNQSAAYFCTAMLNDQGQTTFLARDGVFREADGSMLAIATVGQTVGESGTYQAVDLPRQNNQGTVAFTASLENQGGVLAVWEGDSLSMLQEGDIAPDVDGDPFGTFRVLRRRLHDVNEKDEAVFTAGVTEPLPGGSHRNGWGLFRYDGSGVGALARVRSLAPGDGAFPYRDGLALRTDADVDVNRPGQVLFRAAVDTGDGRSTAALFLHTPGEPIERLLIEGDTIDGAVVDGIDPPAEGTSRAGALNDGGDVVVRVHLAGVGDAVVRWDPEAVAAAGPPPAAATALGQNVPNPFNPATVIPYRLPRAGEVRLDVYDLRGRLVRTLVRGPRTAGGHEARWDGRDDRGRPVASGTYRYLLRGPGVRASRGMVLLR